MAFELEMKHGISIVDFMAPETLVTDKGFDIGLAKEKIVLASVLSGAHGRQVVKTSVENRECKIKFRLKGTIPEIVTLINKINTFILHARNKYQYNYGGRVELKYKWDGATNATYFEIFDGYLDLPSDVLSVEQIHNVDVDSDTRIHYVTLRLVLSPYGYSISPISGTAIQLPLANSGSKTTNPLAFVNAHDDGYNWVKIEDSDVIGDAPAILNLGFTFLTAAAVPDRLYIGHRTGVSAITDPLILEAEDGNYLGPGSGYTDTSSALASNDWYVNVDHTLGNGSNRDEFKWTIDPGDYNGIFRVLAYGFNGMDFDEDMLYAARVDDFKTRLRKGEPYQNITDLGSVLIPPSNIGNLVNLADVEIAVLGRVRQEPSIDIDYQLDFIQLLPVDSGYRVLVNTAATSYAGDTFIESSWSNQYYMTNNFLKTTSDYHTKMRPIMLQPDTDQWLYFGLSVYGAPSQSLGGTVQAWVVPTYKTLAL